MAFTSVRRTADGAAALLYVLSSKGHNGAERRNEIVTPINMCKSVPYLKQMNRYWKCARSNHKIQLVTIIQSFSKKEFDSKNQDDILKANIIGQELVKRLFPNRQALVCTQIDGMGEDDFTKNLKLNGISAKKGKSKTHGDYFTYELADFSQVPEGTKPPKCGFKKRSYKVGEDYCSEAIGRINELLDRIKSRQQSADSITDTESTPEAEQLSKENVNVSEKKISAPQAVSEPAYELEPSMKKSGSSSAKAIEKKAETEAVIPQPVQTSKEDENVPAGVSKMFVNENDDEEMGEDKGAAENRESSDVSAESKPKWSIKIGRFGADYTGFSDSAEVQQKSDDEDEIGYS